MLSCSGTLSVGEEVADKSKIPELNLQRRRRIQDYDVAHVVDMIAQKLQAGVSCPEGKQYQELPTFHKYGIITGLTASFNLQGHVLEGSALLISVKDGYLLHLALLCIYVAMHSAETSQQWYEHASSGLWGCNAVILLGDSIEMITDRIAQGLNTEGILPSSTQNYAELSFLQMFLGAPISGKHLLTVASS